MKHVDKLLSTGPKKKGHIKIGLALPKETGTKLKDFCSKRRVPVATVINALVEDFVEAKIDNKL